MPYSSRATRTSRAWRPWLNGLLLLGLCVPMEAVAQVRGDGGAAPPGSGLFFAEEEGMRFERFSVDQGLSQSAAHHLAQDAYGFLWIGTTDGLNKYDGHDFKAYVHDPAEPRSLPSSEVTALHVDREGTLWVGTTGGLAKLVGAPPALDDQGRPLDPPTRGPEGDTREQAVFVTYLPHSEGPGLGSPDVTAVADDGAGRLWIGTGRGLDRFDPETGVFTHVDHASRESAVGRTVQSLLAEGDMVWVVTSLGLTRFRVDDAGAAVLPVPGSGLPEAGIGIRRMLRARSGTLWATGRGGFGWFDEETESFVIQLPDPSRPPGHRDNTGISLLEDRAGAIWVGTAFAGLVRYDPQTGVQSRYLHDPSDPASLGRAEVFTLFEDYSGILWVGTGQGGLNKAIRRSPAFVTRRYDPMDPGSISHNYVTAMSEGAAGDIWIGTGGGGLNLLEARTGLFRSYRAVPGDPGSLEGDYIHGVLEDQQGVLWVTTAVALHRLTPGGDAFSIFEPGPRLSVGMRVVYEDRAGRLWIGSTNRTTGGGVVGRLLRFDRETEEFEGIDLPEQDGSTSVQAIYEDRAGTLWLGTEQGGLYAFDVATEQFRHYGYEPADPKTLRNSTVQAIHQDSRGDLWIGTRGGGLSVLESDGSGFRHFSQSAGLANDVVYGIAEDPRGLLWLSTNRGLSRFDPASGVFRNYDVTDGLQSNEFNRWAYLAAADGTLFFGGINGLTFFRTGSGGASPPPPPVALSSVSVRNRIVAMGKTAADLKRLELPANQNFFALDFVALDFGNSAQNQYSYRLEDFDDDWIQAGSRRFARYTNVPPGEYEFRLRAANNEGVWNDEGLSIQVAVLPPLWATWWFILLAVATGLSIVYGLYRYRVTQLIRVERARTRIARDLHDDVSATLSSVAFFAEAIRTDVAELDRPRTERFLDLISRSSAEARDRIGDIVWAISAEHQSWSSLIARMRRYGSDVLDGHDVGYQIDLPTDVQLRPLTSEQRQHLWLIFKEMIANALRHSHCTNVGIRLEALGRTIELQVSDDGVGFSADAEHEGNGVKNIRARAAALDATLELDTAPGKGTLWKVSFRS